VLTEKDANVEDAQVVLPCTELQDTLRFFTERLGFRLDAIEPADNPRVAVVSGYGVRLRLERGSSGVPGLIRLACRDPAAFAGGATELTAPNGTLVRLVLARANVTLPQLRPSRVLTRFRDSAFAEGRAGMHYRDLVPERQGGLFIASHIQIPVGGPVADYVHFHEVAFQMIYCKEGWVRVVYEDQGEPFVLRAGDCALQPPRIRHRVLECSQALEVIEISCPAEHETRVEHDLSLPTDVVRADREFGGQRFLRHEAARATWRPWVGNDFEARDLGIARATGGFAGACVARARGSGARAVRQEGDLLFSFVLTGGCLIQRAGAEIEPIASGDAFCMPPGDAYSLKDCSERFEMLEVRLPAKADRIHSSSQASLPR
jgi:mannose-6-phosphate isomerase-like protein (cupin superfamily)